MFNLRVVQQISGLCRETLLEIMDSYGELATKYLQT